jgi:hypothetical protein
MVARQALLLVAALVLAFVGVAWFLRSGLWQRPRLAVFAIAAVVALALLSRRVGVGELVVVAVVALVPAMLFSRRAR